jgi:polysaccharide export outer membrane protein
MYRQFQLAFGIIVGLCAFPAMCQLQSSNSVQIMPSYGSPTAAPALAPADTEVKQTISPSLTAVPEDFAKVKIAPGFLLDILIFDEPDLSGRLRVGDDGRIVMPLVGPISVYKTTTAEAQKVIQDRLQSAEILKKPQVTINVVQYAPQIVTVLGEVASPGRLQMLAPHSLLDIISFAGGETQLAGGEVQLRHVENGTASTRTYQYGRNTDGVVISNVMVDNGDTVFVPRAGIVYVLGAVNRPGGYLMQEDGKIDAAQALSLAMGTTLTAKTAGARKEHSPAVAGARHRLRAA